MRRNKLIATTGIAAFALAFWLQPGTRAGQLPTPEQIAHHDRTGTWRVRVTGRAS